MPNRLLSCLTLALCFSFTCLAQGPAAIACLQDLDVIPPFLLQNDAGARDHLAQFGQKYFDDALAEARSAASQIRGNASCAPVITKYLRMWRHGHLAVVDTALTPGVLVPPQSVENTSTQNLDSQPSIEILSAKTLRLTLKSFDLRNEVPLIILIAARRRDLEQHPNWIIDVRGNGGGGDDSYAPLGPWLMPDETARAGTEILVTPANIEGWTRICPSFGDMGCPPSVTDSIERMRKAVPGTYIPMFGASPTSYYRVEHPEPHRPLRVVILIDGGCGSSCEQFALEARQSFGVKLIGQHTYGSLDYSNVRSYDLPSGRRQLFYATTKSTRVPGLMVDVAGIQPDIYLPREKDADPNEEVSRVNAWLEGGSLAPRKAK